jgi:pyruvate dehydrogenase E2 component (dihydrolipoamide acetyltransferase)
MPNLDLVRKDDVSSFRKIAIGTWKTVKDPTVYGSLELRMEKALAYIEEFRKRTGKRLTVSHLMAKAVAMTLKEMPDANVILRRSRIYQRRVIGVFFQVAMTDLGDDKADLSGATLYRVDQKSLVQICDEFQAKVDEVRARKDKALEKTRSMFLHIPYRLLGTVLDLISWLSFELNLDLRWAGIPSDPFGSIMITNVGSLGLDTAYVPLVPYSHVPMLLALGAVKDAPVVEEGKIVVGKVMRVHATFDHRIIDGFHASIMSRCLRRHMESPAEMFDQLEQLGPGPAGAVRPAAAAASGS